MPTSNTGIDYPVIMKTVTNQSPLALQSSLAQSPLQKPQSFLTYVFQTLRRQQIDWNRRQTAETDTTGAAHFNDIPITSQPELKITIER
jgi:DNA-directed RNA polymerase specialized sigma24 family protein